MGKRKYLNCPGCGKAWSEVKLNRKGYCFPCAMERMSDVCTDMINRQGEYFERWARSMAAYGAQLNLRGDKYVNRADTGRVNR